jgi:hypothetical protein
MGEFCTDPVISYAFLFGIRNADNQLRKGFVVHKEIMLATYSY